MRWFVYIPLIFLVLLLGAGVFAPYDPYQTNPQQSLDKPSSAHLFGTDLLGRDVWSRLLYGGRRTILMAAGASGLAMIGGSILGLVAGYMTSWLAGVIELVITSMLAIPPLVLALAIITWTGSGAWQIALAVGLAQMPFVAQVIRTAVLQVKQAMYVEGSVAMGAGQGWVMTRHLLPAILPVALAYGAVTFSYTIIQGVGLSFLGLGGDLSTPDWGMMLAEGRDTLQEAPWISLAPGVMLVITIMVVNRIASWWSFPKGSF